MSYFFHIFFTAENLYYPVLSGGSVLSY